MARNTTAAVATALSDPANRPVLFVDLDFPSGAVAISTFERDLVVAGKTFTGEGELVGLGPIEETIDIRASGVAVRLSGAAPALLSKIFTDDYQGRRARLWLGMIDSSGALIADPVRLAPYQMDAADFADDADSPIAVIHLESRLRDLLTPRARRWSNEDQKATFAADTGFRYVESLADGTARMESI